MKISTCPSVLRVVATRTRLPSIRTQASKKDKNVEKGSLFELGPIGMTIGGEDKKSKEADKDDASSSSRSLADKVGLSMGPISLTFSDDFSGRGIPSSPPSTSSPSTPTPTISSLTTDAWRQQFENPDGTVSLWVEEEFNAGSRLVGGRAVHQGRTYGLDSGEGPSRGASLTHTVQIKNHYQDGAIITVTVPEDRYILWEAEEQGLELPWACRMGCCTACAVRVTEGEVYQPEALGISKELRDAGYALMCVGYARSNVVMETVSEDEIYELQFGEVFAQRALDKENKEFVERDDFAMEIALGDE